MPAIKKARGFSLIELMAVVVVTGILAAAAVPLGGAWVDRARLSSAKGELRESFGRAKNVAIRNAEAVAAGEPVTSVCLSDTNALTILAHTGLQAPDCANGLGEQIFSTQLPDSVSVTENANPVNCMCFNNWGVLTNNSCGICLTDASLKLEVGDRTETILVY